MSRLSGNKRTSRMENIPPQGAENHPLAGFVRRDGGARRERRRKAAAERRAGKRS